MLTALTSEHAVLLAEERGLIRVVVDGRRETASLGHPLYGEVARERCPELRRRRRHADLAVELERSGLRRREDRLRATAWRLESGMTASPRLLMSATRLAWSAHDYPLAQRLGRAALAEGGGASAAILLATLLDFAQQPDEAKRVLDSVEEPGDEETRVELVLARAGNLAWGMNLRPQADALLDRAESAHYAEPYLTRITVHRLALAASAAEPAAALELARRVPLHALPAPLRAQALNATALALCYAGRTAEAAEKVRTALAEANAWRDTIPALISPLHSTWALCGYFAGDLAMIDEAVASLTAAAAGQRGWSQGEGSLSLARGHAATLRGELDLAMRALHGPAGHTALTVGGCMGAYAAVQALRGEAAAAAETLQAAVARNRTTWTAFTRWVAMTRVWIAAAGGDGGRAAELAVSAAGDCRLAGLPGFEFVSLHDAVRLGRPEVAADRLAELAATHDGPRVRLAARHARALADGDGQALAEVAAGFAGLGLRLHAAEAAAQAAVCLRRAGRERAARAAETESWSLASACQGPDTPALRTLAAPDLTARELEVALLTAAGLSHREIAEKLVISMRTAMNHRNQVYMKLGVHSPAELARLLSRFRRLPRPTGPRRSLKRGNPASPP
ncbi:helix-turn-helix transcriptional regulator [Sinosporangium siamense]|nr:helix-turn-helix transcriptional regulator [Sinosporangium siamense]